jgi:hypothetical protein
MQDLLLNDSAFGLVLPMLGLNRPRPLILPLIVDRTHHLKIRVLNHPKMLNLQIAVLRPNHRKPARIQPAEICSSDLG